MTQLRALTRLAFREAGLGAGGIEQVHRAIADRAFVPGPAKLLHDAIAGVRGRVRLGDGAWFAPYAIDVGLGSSKLTVQGLAGVGYAFRWGDLLLVWRHLREHDPDLPMVRDPEGFARQHVEQFLRGAASVPQTSGRGAPSRRPRTRRTSPRPVRCERRGSTPRHGEASIRSPS